MRFSEYFELGRTQAYLDFVDIPLNTDLAVFLDPSSIKSLDSDWGHELSSLLQTFFETVLRSIRNGEDRKAKALLASLKESNEFHLGYSAGRSRGHGFGTNSADTVWSALTKSKAASSGLLRDLEDTALLIPGVGTDMISDAVCNILRGPLILYTQHICRYHGIELTKNVASGPIWNPQLEIWEEAMVDLPVTREYGKVILVPKILVRSKISYHSNEYYSHFLLPEMQREHLEIQSPLVESLKNGRLRVTKKKLVQKYGKDKLAIVNQTIEKPYVLDEYREQKAENPPEPLSHSQFAEIESTTLPDLDSLLEDLKRLPVGAKYAGEYEDIVEKIFSVIFYPSLCSPTKQHNIHQGRKRIDITYINEAKNGFFYWLSQHYTSPKIFIECKNYGKEVGNPEIDQLSGRFSPSRGKVGILVCRSIENRERLTLRCVDTAKDDRGYIIALDDLDIELLVQEYKDAGEKQNFIYLRKAWNALID
ncbi:restriction endonuclease [Enterovibrio paralichthyis]|uniref:restriction endonuclease n=1 Tax=Enterovibrio paralichthyis TaxID=2853805 RepID=UPI001C48F83C|nr:restriction endonuclease [Enterovibrio paralichthyis]MBV7300197.1 restriction endonuclease [Enterovibrio paralichthyis]